ncbi:hypothetical protein HanXRQr2_Chr06g0242981 [Helianthus annuus]|uniref:Uncharacterized protein n=1 Tax=Helianthus annuus TaxID=4232 RepID=A0A9K3NIN9_HELAN|nr:hypothetical protein HanXRQr2_Chr06g0242981 [Helianthus annuus]
MGRDFITSLQLHCFVVSYMSLSPQVLIASALQQTPLLYTQPPFPICIKSRRSRWC